VTEASTTTFTGGLHRGAFPFCPSEFAAELACTFANARGSGARPVAVGPGALMDTILAIARPRRVMTISSPACAHSSKLRKPVLGFERSKCGHPEPQSSS